jgi:hypothetical protein
VVRRIRAGQPDPGPGAPEVASTPSPKDYTEFKFFLWKQAKEAGEPKLVGEPKIGDTVPKWVQLKPLVGSVLKGSVKICQRNASENTLFPN